MRRLCILSCLLFATVLHAGDESLAKLKRVGRANHPPIREMSGLAKSRVYKDVWWVHNDSGDSARLFPIDSKGKLIMPPFMKSRFSLGEKQEGKPWWPGLVIETASNGDWEDICTDGDKLYIAEMGNNGNARRDLGVYVVNEPNPRAITESRPLAFWPVYYPEQKSYPAKKWHFDCESIFIDKGQLYFLTKHRATGRISGIIRGTKLYRLDTKHTDRPNRLTLISKHPKLWGPTGADLSPDGKHLAVLTLDSIWVFDRPAKGDAWLDAPSKRYPFSRMKALQAEGLCFDSNTVIRVNNEQRSLFTLDLSTKKSKEKKRF